MAYLDRTEEREGRRVLLFPWEEREVHVRDDAETALRILATFEGDGTPLEKLSQAVSDLFLEPEELSAVNDFSGLLAAVCWECLALDIDGSHKEETGGERVMDWETDHDYIASSLLMCYGVSWDEAVRRFSYRQLLSMVGMVSHDTPMGQALYYRTAKPPEATKFNQEERREFRKRRDFWALREPGQSINDRMADAFAAMKEMARG